MVIRFNGNEVELDLVFGPEPEDTFVRQGFYVDSGTELTEAELDEIEGDYSGELQEQWHEHKVSQADFLYSED
jgi:hypothetical protein